MGPGECPFDAVFLALEDQIHGFPLRANGLTTACQVIQGSTGLQTARSNACDRYGFLHVAQFLTSGTIDIFSPDANGNVAPLRSTQVETNDLFGIAVDKEGNDWVGSLRFPGIVYSPKGA